MKRAASSLLSVGAIVLSALVWSETVMTEPCAAGSGAGRPAAQDDARWEVPQGLSPQKVQALALELLKSGKQSQAEELLAHYVVLQSGDQRVVFLHACCLRSRFMEAEAGTHFQAVVDANASSVEGRCAAHVLALDAGTDTDKNFDALRALADDHPDDPMLRWMAAVQCRALDKNAEGVKQYKKLLETWDPGPALVHQTYANLLHELERYEEALVERRKAVAMAPQSWAYEGLANTLTKLKRADEANDAYAVTVELAPESAKSWGNWAWSLTYARRPDAAIEKVQRALALNPNYSSAWSTWGDCLYMQGRELDALEKYRKVLEINPGNDWARGRVTWIESQKKLQQRKSADAR